MKNNTTVLIEVLMDRKALWEDRHDAALDLGLLDDSDVVQALITNATNLKEDHTLVETCGESLGIIWTRQKKMDVENLNRLLPHAYYEAYAVIKTENPEWIKEYLLEENNFKGNKSDC